MAQFVLLLFTSKSFDSSPCKSLEEGCYETISTRGGRRCKAGLSGESLTAEDPFLRLGAEMDLGRQKGSDRILNPVETTNHYGEV